MEPNLGTRAATRQSWERDSARELFRELQKEHPKAARDRLVKLMYDRILDDESAGLAICHYVVTTFTNAQESYERNKPEPPARPTAEEITARQQADVAQRASIKAQIMFLNLPMANGKLARNCTGAELIEIGGAWIKVGKKIGVRAVLGQSLNEEELRKLMPSQKDS